MPTVAWASSETHAQEQLHGLVPKWSREDRLVVEEDDSDNNNNKKIFSICL